MAHSDVFIFLNSITWVFFLFLGLYFILVTLFLPSLYKKIRLHALVRGAYTWKLSAKLLNFFVIKLILVGARVPGAYLDLFAKRVYFYSSSLTNTGISSVYFGFSKPASNLPLQTKFKLFL